MTKPIPRRSQRQTLPFGARPKPYRASVPTNVHVANTTPPACVPSGSREDPNVVVSISWFASQARTDSLPVARAA
jgi:hypothetical protein